MGKGGNEWTTEINAQDLTAKYLVIMVEENGIQIKTNPHLLHNPIQADI